MSRGICPTVVALAVTFVCAPSATASTQIGSTFPPISNCNLATWLHSGQPTGSHAVPFSGVITSWSFQAASTAPDLNFKVTRPTSGGNHVIVGESGVKDTVPSTLNTFPAQIPAQAGDLIGYHTATPGNCKSFVAGYTIGFYASLDDPTVGSEKSFGSLMGQRLDLSATLEPDADGDGFGDETQDQCLGQAGPVNGCPEPPAGDSNAPSAQITKGPKHKTKKKTATFEFTGTDTRAIAGFQCSLDGGAFASCTSPHTVKVKRGKHAFEVRAVDEAGNFGAPASDSWRRKKKK